ncbi:MAG: hypothetical protein ACRYFS_21955 [Janthinobacterium lividum]
MAIIILSETIEFQRQVGVYLEPLWRCESCGSETENGQMMAVSVALKARVLAAESAA